MSLTSLQTFLTILETGSLVAASRRLNVTQSTVTARLKALEQTLGQTLLLREKSGVILTASGQRLKRYAETMTELWAQARHEAALPSAVSAVCNIGCHGDLWPGLGKRLFDAIRAGQQAVALSVWHGGEGELAGWLNSGLTDLSLTFWPAAARRQTVHHLPPDRLIMVSTVADARARPGPGYVFVEAGEAFGRQHAAAFSGAEAARISFGDATLGLAHILEHGGQAYLPERIAAPQLAEGRLHRVKDAPEVLRPCYLVGNDRATADWPWLGDMIDALGAQPGAQPGPQSGAQARAGAGGPRA